jgi:hypothetical protein
LSCQGEARPYRVEPLDGSLALDPAADRLAVEFRGMTHGGNGRQGEWEMAGEVSLGPIGAIGPGSLRLKAKSVAADVLRPILLRLGEPAYSAGEIGVDLQIEWTDPANALAISVKSLVADEFALVTSGWLRGDQLSIRHLSGEGTIQYLGDRLVASQLRLESEFAEVRADGEFPWRRLAESLTGGQLPASDFAVSGQVDLAHLARMLPRVAGLRNGVELRRAELTFNSFSRQEGSRRRLLVDAEAKNIDAVHAGRPIQWGKPLRLSAALSQEGQRPRLESLQLETSAVAITGSSDLQSGRLQAAGDMGRLLDELGQIFSVDGYDLAGTFAGEMTWTSRAIDQIGADAWPVEIAGDCRLQDLVVQIPGFDRFAEPQAQMAWQARGVASRNGIERIDAGALEFSSGGDRLTAQLTEPVEQPRLSSAWRADLEAVGRAESWLARLQPLLPESDWKAAGELMIRAPATIQSTAIHLHSATYECTDLAVDGYGLQIREPKLTGAGDLAFDWQNWILASNDWTLLSSSVAARAAPTRLAYSADGWQWSGAVSYRADVNRVSHWFPQAADPTTVQWFGEAEGSFQCVPASAALAGQFHTTIKNLAAAKLNAADPTAAAATAAGPSWTVLWQEPAAEVQANLAVDLDWDSIQLERAVIQSQLAGIEARGTLADLADTLTVDLRGKWLPNWAALTRIIQASLGDQVALEGGREPQVFVVRGPLLASADAGGGWSLQQLTARTSVAWEQGRIYGLPVGGSSVAAQLHQGLVRFQEASIPLSQGTVHLHPVIDLRGEPQVIFPAGTILESVELTPEVCQSWLRYVAPLLSQATRTRGRLSLSSEGMQFPLFEPLRGSAKGKIVIDAASVQPGPLGQELIALVGSIKQIVEGRPLGDLLQPAVGGTGRPELVLMELPAQEIGFELKDGQMVHQAMTINVRGIPIRTRGTIGIDTRLNLLAEIPILDEWVQRQPLLASWKGTSLRLPIGGSLAQPRVERGAITELVQRLLGQAAAQQIDGRLKSLIQESLGGSIPGLNVSEPSDPSAQGAAAPLPTLGEALQKSAESQLQKSLERLWEDQKK